MTFSEDLSIALYYSNIAMDSKKNRELMKLNQAYHFADNGCNGIQTAEEVAEAKEEIHKRLMSL